MARPTDPPPTWATEIRTDPVSGINNRIEPPPEKILGGWNRFELPARQWLNWFQYGAGAWLTHLAAQDLFMPVNTANTDTGADALPDLSSATGFVFIVDTDDSSNFYLGWLVNISGWDFVTIASNGITIDSISGRDINITGPTSYIINTLVLPVQVQNP